MKIISESFAGLATAASRVIEIYHPEEKRIFDDRLALDLLPFGWRMIIRLLYLPGLRSVLLSLRERRVPGVLGGLLCRTRYIDDVLKKLLEEGVEQLVILGAGFDSRVYRIAGVDQVQVFEVDLPETIKLKQARIEKVLGSVPGYVTFVGMDFDKQKLGDLLKVAGFQKGMKTLFIWEGVTQYITAEAVKDTLAFVSDVSGDGSAIVFTYIRQGIIDGTACSEVERRIVSFAGRSGSPWIFGLDPTELEQYLADRELMLIDDVGVAEYHERYLVSLGREMSVFEGERVAFARVKGPLAT